MKNLLITILVLTSQPLFANCQVAVTQWGVNGAHLSTRYITSRIAKALEPLGYTISNESDSTYKMHLHYYGIMNARRSKTVGTYLTFSNQETQTEIAKAQSDKFRGREKMISRITFNKNLRKIVGDISYCETN